jgi:two-component system sensor histidine kinase KdpD
VVAGAILLVLVTAVGVLLRDDVSPPVVAASMAGRVAAIASALVATLVLNLAFTVPYWTLKVDALEDWLGLAVFLGVALVVGRLVTVEAERRRAAEQRADELEQLHRRLEEVVAERERLADEAARLQVIAEVDDQRAALLRSVSHDLRTPLATIRAVASDLRDRPGYDAATQEELLETVCDEAERLDRLVANLLSMSRIEAGALQPDRQAVDLGELVHHRIRRLAGLFRQVRLQLELPDEGPLVDGDYTQLDQVLTNLVENAARHAPPTTAVHVGAHIVNGHAELAVGDEGIGVADYEREQIFEPFRQGEQGGSSGVGLAICKAIVEAHDGSIRVERTPGGGATFVVSLPLHHD